MSNLKEVLEFIKNSNKEDINKIIDQINIRKSELRYAQKSQFRVGDIVGIDHKKIPSNLNFRIIKINPKNIKVQGDINTYTVSPSLLIKR